MAASAMAKAAYIVVCNGEYTSSCMESLIEEMLASSYATFIGVVSLARLR